MGRRAALDGFITLAPDALSPFGGYPGNDDAGRELQKKRTRDEMLEDFIAAYNYLKNHKDCNGHIGVVGFCFGGWIANMMAVKIPTLQAAVPYYGGQPTAAEAELIKTPDSGPIRKLRHTRERRLACLRSYFTKKQGTTYSTFLRRCEPWFSQQHHTALRRKSRYPILGTYHCFF